MKKNSPVRNALSKALKGLKLFSTGVVDLIDEVASTNQAFNIRDHEMYPFTDEFAVLHMGATTRLKFDMVMLMPAS